MWLQTAAFYSCGIRCGRGCFLVGLCDTVLHKNSRKRPTMWSAGCVGLVLICGHVASAPSLVAHRVHALTDRQRICQRIDSSFAGQVNGWTRTRTPDIAPISQETQLSIFGAHVKELDRGPVCLRVPPGPWTKGPALWTRRST